MKYTILAPEKNYNGISASVSFRDGKGYTQSDHLAEWFREHGYEVTQEENTAPPESVAQEENTAQGTDDKKKTAQ